ncbi:TauD/TfdA family dioxygenase [Actinocorallia lasiicapitis]
MKTTTLGEDGFVCEIVGADCAKAEPGEVAALKELLFEHRVLVLRDQAPSPAQYQRFMASIGVPVPHVLQELTVEGFPAILKISDYLRPDGSPFGVLDGGTYWHSDMSYLPELGIATSLYAVRATARSGGTGFLDLRRGWDVVARDPGLLAALGCRSPGAALDVEVVHRFGNRHAVKDAAAPDQKLSDRQQSTLTGARHRLVERHPVTGTACLFATSGSAMTLPALDAEPAAQALDRLEETLLGALEIYTHRYLPGDLVLWDNMSTLHRGVGVTPTRDWDDSRLLHRINVNYGST